MSKQHLAGLAAAMVAAFGIGGAVTMALDGDEPAPLGDRAAFCRQAEHLPALGEGAADGFVRLVQDAPAAEIREQAEAIHEVAEGLEQGDETAWMRLFVDPELADLDTEWAETLEETCGIVQENRIPISEMQEESTGTLRIGDAEIVVD